MGWQERAKPVAEPAWLARAKPVDEPGIGEAALRGAGQGATLGFGDELAAGTGAALQKVLPESWGGIDYGKPLNRLYRENRDALRKENEAARKAHPVAFAGGQIVGGLPGSMIAGGAAPSAARLIGTGAGLAGVAGAGESDAETAGGVAGDAVKGGLVGGALAGGLVGAGKAAPYLKQALEKLAVKTGRRVLTNVTNSLSSKAPVSSEAVLEALDSGAIKFGGTSQGAAQRLEVAREAAGQKYADIVAQLEAKGVTGPRAQALAHDLLGEADAISTTTLSSPRPGVFRSAAEDLATKPTDSAGRLGLSQAESMKRELQHLAKSEYDKLQHLQTPAGEAKEAVASRLRQAVEDEVQAQAAKAPDLAAQFEPVKQQLGRLIEASNVAREGASRAAKRNAFSLKDALFAQAGAASGYGAHGMLGAAIGGPGAAVASHILRTRGPSTAAVALKGGADALDFLAGPALTPAQMRVQALIKALQQRALPALSEEAGSLATE